MTYVLVVAKLHRAMWSQCTTARFSRLTHHCCRNMVHGYPQVNHSVNQKAAKYYEYYSYIAVCL